MSVDVAIVGAGVIGTSLADALVRRGRAVALVEAQAAGAGTSATSYAWINSHKKHPLDYHAINVAGTQAWRRIAEALPDVVTFAGHVEVAESDEHRATLQQRTDRLIALGYDARWSTPAEARERTPLPVADDALVACFDGEGHAFPLRWIAHLTDSLDASGHAERIHGTAATIEPGDGHASVVLHDARRVDATTIVVCAGAGSDRLVASAGGALPLVDPVPDGSAFGYLADVRAADHGVTGLVTTDRVSFRPGEHDTLLVQALDLDSTAAPGVAPLASVAETIRDRVAALLPHTIPEVLAVRVGHRVIPADGRTAAGPIAPGSPVWAVATHSGIVLAPWLAETIADELGGGEPDPLLAGFRPTRFLDAHAHAAVVAPRAAGDQ